MKQIVITASVAAAFLVWMGSGLSVLAQTPIRELPPPPKLYTDAEAEVFARRLGELDREDRAGIRSVIQRLGIDRTRIGPGRIRIGNATEWTDHQISRSYWITESRFLGGVSTNVVIGKTFPPNPPIEARRPGPGGGEPPPIRSEPSAHTNRHVRRVADQFAESILALHPEKMGADQPEKWRAFNARHKEIRSLGPEIIPHLCRLAGHENPRVRRWALDAIPWVEKGSENAVQTLVNGLADPAPAVRFEAAEGLGRIGRPGTHDYSRLFEALHDEDQNVRTAAGQSMAALSPTPAELPKLIAALDTADPVVRRLAADGLGFGRRSAASALPALDAMAGDKDIDVRSAAFRAARSIRETPIPPWRWNAESSSPLHSMTGYNGPYDLEIARKEPAELVSRARKDGRILHEWPVHAMGTPFVIDGDLLYYPRLGEFAAGCVLISFDLEQGRKLWETDLVAMGPIGHSKYTNHGINLSLNERILRIDGSEAAGTYTEFVEAGTGKTLANYRSTRRRSVGAPLRGFRPRADEKSLPPGNGEPPPIPDEPGAQSNKPAATAETDIEPKRPVPARPEDSTCGEQM